MNIGWLVLSKMRSAVRRLCGQVSGFPSGAADQSYARISAPISPPPARKSAEVGLLIFNIRDDRSQVQPNLQPELNRLSETMQTPWPGTRFQNIFQVRNKMAGACAAVPRLTMQGDFCGLPTSRKRRYFMRPAALSAP